MASRSSLSEVSGFWYQLGPLFLVASLSVSLMKGYLFDALLLLVGIVGMVLIRKAKKKGMIIAFVLLAALTFFSSATWSAFLFSATIGVSWVIAYLGGKEASLLYVEKENEKRAIEARCDALEKLSRESDQTARKMTAKIKALEEELAGVQKQIAAEKSAQLLKVEHNSIVSQEEMDPEEQKNARYWQQQYAQMRRQFDEKSEMLDAARKELFLVESKLLELERANQEHLYDQLEQEFSVVSHLKAMEEETGDLQAQVASLQECLSHLLVQPKTTRKPKKVKSEEDLLSFLK